MRSSSWDPTTSQHLANQVWHHQQGEVNSQKSVQDQHFWRVRKVTQKLSVGWCHIVPDIICLFAQLARETGEEKEGDVEVLPSWWPAAHCHPGPETSDRSTPPLSSYSFSFFFSFSNSFSSSFSFSLSPLSPTLLTYYPPHLLTLSLPASPFYFLSPPLLLTLSPPILRLPLLNFSFFASSNLSSLSLFVSNPPLISSYPF